VTDITGNNKMFRRFFEPMIIRVLTEEAGAIVELARQNASWSSTIPGALGVGPVERRGDGSYRATITVNTDIAPQAAAFEFGSGIHSQENPGLYPIHAVDAPRLVFWWEKRQKWFVGYQLPYGHPGVAARPYIKPAFEARKRSLMERIAGIVGISIVDMINVEFKRVKV
jgi:hypothetical protein